MQETFFTLISDASNELWKQLKQEEHRIAGLYQESPIGAAFPIRLPDAVGPDDTLYVYIGIHPSETRNLDSEKTRNSALFYTTWLANYYHSDISHTLRNLAIELLIKPYLSKTQNLKQHGFKNSAALGEPRSHNLILEIMTPDVFLKSLVSHEMASFGGKLATGQNLAYFDKEHSMYISTSDREEPGLDAAGFIKRARGKPENFLASYQSYSPKLLNMIRTAIAVSDPNQKKYLSLAKSDSAPLTKQRFFGGRPLDDAFVYSVTPAVGDTVHFILDTSDVPGLDMEVAPALTPDAAAEAAKKKEAELRKKLDAAEWEATKKEEKADTALGLVAVLEDEMKKLREENERLKAAPIAATTTGAKARQITLTITPILQEFRAKPREELVEMCRSSDELREFSDLLNRGIETEFATKLAETSVAPVDMERQQMELMRAFVGIHDIQNSLKTTLSPELAAVEPVKRATDGIQSAIGVLGGPEFSRVFSRREMIKQIRFEQAMQKMLRGLLVTGGEKKPNMEMIKQISKLLLTSAPDASPEDKAMLQLILGGDVSQ